MNTSTPNWLLRLTAHPTRATLRVPVSRCYLDSRQKVGNNEQANALSSRRCTAAVRVRRRDRQYGYTSGKYCIRARRGVKARAPSGICFLAHCAADRAVGHCATHCADSFMDPGAQSDRYSVGNV